MKKAQIHNFSINRAINNDYVYNYYINHTNLIYNVKYETTIPRNCFMCYLSENIPDELRLKIARITGANKNIQFHINNLKDCRVFIEKNFPKDIRNAYDGLRCDKHKSELWCYCVLYKHGGLYLDPSFDMIKGFKFEKLYFQEQFVLEDPSKWINNDYSISTDFILVKPNNTIIKNCISAILYNVNNQDYGMNYLDITGPSLLGKIYFQQFKNPERICIFYNSQMKTLEYCRNVIANKNNFVNHTTYDLEIKDKWEKHGIYKHSFEEFCDTRFSLKDNRLPTIACVIHIGSIETYYKMKHYVTMLVKNNNSTYQMHFYINIINTIDRLEISNMIPEYSDCYVSYSDNVGFDIASFLYFIELWKKENRSYDYVLKIHTKNDDTFREDLLQPLLKDKNTFQQAIQRLEGDREIGMIGSKAVCCMSNEKDILNKKHLNQLIHDFSKKKKYNDFLFIAGTMFLTRFTIVKQIFFDLNINDLYHSCNNKYTFDHNWYYYMKIFRKVDLRNEHNDCYLDYIKEGRKTGYSKNIFDALENPKNMSEVRRDGMIEHAYERFFSHIVYDLDYKIHWI